LIWLGTPSSYIDSAAWELYWQSLVILRFCGGSQYPINTN
jgi:hypothetical protein